jgi:predicted dehydrogenase
MQKLRIAVAGAGLIGVRHIEELAHSDAAVLSGIVAPARRALEVARRAGVPLHGTLAELFTRDRPDGVILGTPNQVHVEQALECIAAGVPVLVEKPLAHTLEAGERLVQAAERAHAKLLVGHHRRHGAVLRAAGEVIRAGTLGRLVAVLGCGAFYKPETEGYFDGPNAWRREPGGGPILLNMIHEVDNLRALVGEVVAVQAMSSNSTRGFAVEDTAAIALRFANGVLATFLMSDTVASPKSWEQTSGESLAFVQYEDEDACVLMGTMGQLGIPTLRLRRFARAEDRSWFKPLSDESVPFARLNPMAQQLAHFVTVIRGEAEPLVGARDGLQNLRVVDAILRAAREGGTVEVPTG